MFADAAAVMQAVESQTLILYHTDLRGEWPASAARSFAARLPYLRRLAAAADDAPTRASLAGVALALRALTRVAGDTVHAGELVFAQGQKPVLAPRAALVAGDAWRAWQPGAAGRSPSMAHPDFSISHAGHWVGCAAVSAGRVGFDVELGEDARITRWVAQEALLKAAGEGMRALPEVRALGLATGPVRWRELLWHPHALQLFPGARACVMTSASVREIQAHALPLTGLFAP